jgi:3-phosphoshikimate 1-carboxyvinyltransferase
MHALLIAPINHPLHAVVRVPGSKSLTNRALALAALADGTTTLTNALESDDSRYFIESLQRLGFNLQFSNSLISIHGLGGRIPSARAELFVGNAGTAARFLTAFVALGHGEYIIDGNARMRERPIRDLLDALAELGANAESATGCPPVKVRATGLPGGRAQVKGDVSSQFLSGLLMVAPYARSPLEIEVAGELNSKPYVDMTLAIMADFGVTVEREGYERFRVASQRYRALGEYKIESDASAASYFFAAPAVCGGSVQVQNISRRSKQGDIAFLDVLAQMGCEVKDGVQRLPTLAEVGDFGFQETDWVEVSGPPGLLHGVTVDLRDIPDTAQTLAALAPFADSPTIIRGIASARVKETDRVAAMCNELRRLGVAVEEYPDGLEIYPCDKIQPATIRSYDDHRMAMAFALVGLRAEGIAIENPGCVSKTFPNYFEVVESLR